MTKVVSRPLPHMVGTADVANAELKRIATLFMENFASLARQVAEMQEAVRELQRGLSAARSVLRSDAQTE